MHIPDIISEEWEARYINISLTGRVLIAGPPGSGKTLIAFLRAKVLASKKIPVSILMFGNVLQRYTENALSNKKIGIYTDTLLGWLKKWWSDHRIMIDGSYDPPEMSKYNPDWELMLEKMALRVAQKKPIRDWGHLIIDEAQDFPVSMFIFFRFVSAQLKNGGMTIFADENQRLLENNSTINEIKTSLAVSEDNFFSLTENYRNTYEIAVLAQHFYVGLPTGIPQAPSFSGDRPELCKASSFEAQVHYIIKSLKIRRYGQVGIFTQFDSVREKLVNKLQSGLKDQYKIQSYSSSFTGKKVFMQGSFPLTISEQ